MLALVSRVGCGDKGLKPFDADIAARTRRPDRGGVRASAGTIIGTTVGHAATGALIGDHLMEQQRRHPGASHRRLNKTNNG
jgi:hypothetical protein